MYRRTWWSIVLVMSLMVGIGIHTPPQVALAAANLAPNPSFEDVCDAEPCQWRPETPEESTLLTSPIAHSGNASARLTRLDYGAQSLRSVCIAVDPQTTYTTGFSYLVALDQSVSSLTMDAYTYATDTCDQFIGYGRLASKSHEHGSTPTRLIAAQRSHIRHCSHERTNDLRTIGG